MEYSLITIILFAALFMYFKIALYFSIIDKPNERSSHSNVTIRGGGIVFPLAAILWYLFYGFSQPILVFGLLLIAIISFTDDLINLSGKVRIIIHLLAVSLLFVQLQLFALPWFLLLTTYVLTIGWINAFNFMDGINAITPFYAIIALATFFFLNQTLLFATNDLLFILIISLIIFSYFNARKHAKTFAGDVGSVSLAFLLAWFMLSLILKTGKWEYILFFGVYGVDSVLTIVSRLFRYENIFRAHRSHIYQYLSNELQWPHVTVAVIYAFLQLLLNIGLIIFMRSMPEFSGYYVAICLVLLSLLYLFTRILVIKKVKV